MLAEEVTRRLLLAAAPAALAAIGGGYAVIESGLGSSTPATVMNLPAVPVAAASLTTGGIIQRLVVTNDLVLQVSNPTVTQVPMQTNGNTLRIELTINKAAIDLSKISLDVSDAGYDADGIEVSYPRTVTLRDILHGPFNQTAAVNEGPTIIYVILAEQLYNQDDQWRSTITAVHFQAGWMAGAPAEEIGGLAVERADSLAYPLFPVKILTPPFQRMTGDGLPVEISGLNQWGRDNRPFARVEAWATMGGIDGPIAASSIMSASADTPTGTTPSGLAAPVYRLTVQHADWRDGAGEIRYRVFPFVGPAWRSADQGEAFPTLAAPKALPYCQDLTNSWAPLYGIVSVDGVGLAGTDLRGLSFSIAGAIASGLGYKDAASVATAVRAFNRSTVALQIADGLASRQTNHDDIAGGVAVLRAVPGSTAGQNVGAYVLRTGFASQTLFPPGATPFEIRSESGLPDPSVRLRGVNPAGVIMSAATKACPSRLLLRGLWLDGTGTTAAGNSVIDGSTPAGQAVVRPTIQSAAYQITYDCIITENPAAGAGSPTRLHPGYVWDIRLSQTETAGAASLMMTAAFSGLVCSLGSLYSSVATIRYLPLTTILAAKLVNTGVSDRDDSRYSPVSGPLLLNTASTLL